VGILLDQLKITLNDCALDLFKPIAAQLYSKDEQTQLEAADAIKALSRKCMDENVISNLLTCAFGILNGSDGKLSSASQRIGVLNGIGNLSYHGTSDNKLTNEISKKACDFFIVLLKNELHEATVLAALNALFKWCQRFKGDFSTSLTDFFKQCLTLKSSSPAVAYKYLQLINDAYGDDQISSASPLISTLLEVVEKAYKQPHLTVEVQKALPASILLLKMNAALNIDSDIKPFWNWISDKRLFLNDKFVENLDAEGTCLLVDLIQKIIYENPYKLGETNLQHYYQLLIMMLNSIKFYGVRRKAEILLKKLLSTVSGRHICLLLIDQFSLFFTGLSDRVIPQSGIIEHTGDSKDNYDPKIVAQSLSSCCKVPELNCEDAEEICLKVLPLFCKEYLHDYKSYFLNLLDFYKQEPFDFVTKFACKLRNEIESLEL
uniref:Stalled ribosome sensor GCN1-like N-terminal domain-containing protein n=1 Tax=Romanomermis culicivorax TaxID=13658 RepID=A0A915IJY4_ROMCU